MAFWKATANYKFRSSLLSHSVESRKAWKSSFIHLALSIGSTNITNRGDSLNLPVTNQWIIASALTHNISIFRKFSDAEKGILNSFIQKRMLAFLPWVQKYALKKLHFSFQQVIRSLSSARTFQAQTHKFWLLELGLVLHSHYLRRLIFLSIISWHMLRCIFVTNVCWWMLVITGS